MALDSKSLGHLPPQWEYMFIRKAKHSCWSFRAPDPLELDGYCQCLSFKFTFSSFFFPTNLLMDIIDSSVLSIRLESYLIG